MALNVKISLCKITAASRLFQRNYYLPLLKPLSPKDALRRKIITGQNVLGARIEHYIPVLTSHEEKTLERKRRPKGCPIIKKRVRRNDRDRYVEPFFDDDMEGHVFLQNILRRKPKGKGQRYLYEIPDKKCNLVISAQMERALKDRDIIDVTMAQRSEKILVKMNDGRRITVPVASFNTECPLYRGSGWTKEFVEEEHHHGKETMSMAKLFEAKEQGVEEWELEMMRMANKRKKKVRGEDCVDWKQMLAGCIDNMDWDKFEEDSKQIVEEIDEPIEEENIPMAVDDMEKTRHVNEKLKEAGEEVLKQLPVMKEIPAVIKSLDTGELCELHNISGAQVKISEERTCFVTGQMVKTDENEVFVPGQTVENEDGTSEYTPGITIYMDDEPTLLPGLVFGEEEDEKPPMFLPGESTITEKGQLKFEVNEADIPPIQHKRYSSSSPSPPPDTKPKPKPKKEEEEYVVRRRVFDEPEPVVKEKVKKKPVVVIEAKPVEPKREIVFKRAHVDDTLKQMEEERRQREEAERKRQKERKQEKILKQEGDVDKLRMVIRKKCKEIKFEQPPPYVPVEPVSKSQKLVEMERSIRKGKFLEDDHTKEILEKARGATRMLKYQHVLDAYKAEFGRIRF